MNIDFSTMITPQSKELLIKIHRTLNELEPAIATLVGEGWPFQKHQAALQDRRIWNDAMLKRFNVTIPSTN